MVTETRSTDVWAKMWPLREEPVWKPAKVFTRKVPSRCELIPAST